MVTCELIRGALVVGLLSFVGGKDVQPVVRYCIAEGVDENRHPTWEPLVHTEDLRWHDEFDNIASCMIVMERYHTRYPNALLNLVVEERDVCSAFLPVEELYQKFLNLLDNDDQEETTVD